METMDLIDGAETQVTLSTGLADSDEQVYNAIVFDASDSEIIVDI